MKRQKREIKIIPANSSDPPINEEAKEILKNLLKKKENKKDAKKT